MSSEHIKWITRSALGITLVIMAQLLGKLLPGAAGAFTAAQLLTGSLVNCVLLVFCFYAGVWSGAVISAVSPVLAMLTGIGPALPVLTPLIACGNLLLTATAWLCGKKRGTLNIPGCLAAAAAKCAFLSLTAPIVLSAAGAPEKQSAAISFMLSWPQGVTAVCGGLLALAVLHRLQTVKA